MVAADHVLFDDTDYCLQMDDNDELDTIVMEDEDEAEVKEEDEEQELIIIPFKETCSKHIRGFRRYSCLYKYRLICAWQQDSRHAANLYVCKLEKTSYPGSLGHDKNFDVSHVWF